MLGAIGHCSPPLQQAAAGRRMRRQLRGAPPPQIHPAPLVPGCSGAPGPGAPAAAPAQQLHDEGEAERAGPAVSLPKPAHQPRQQRPHPRWARGALHADRALDPHAHRRPRSVPRPRPCSAGRGIPRRARSARAAAPYPPRAQGSSSHSSAEARPPHPAPPPAGWFVPVMSVSARPGPWRGEGGRRRRRGGGRLSLPPPRR